MKLIILPILTMLLGALYASVKSPNPSNDNHLFQKQSMMISSDSDTVAFDQQKALEKLRKRIKGKENLPASEVFDSLEVFKQVPAGRLLRIMELGFSHSLGVKCIHCHNPENWASNEKPQKQIARDMMAMVGTINSKLLPNIQNLKSEKPIVNCTTCHRGHVKPALRMDGSDESSNH